MFISSKFKCQLSCTWCLHVINVHAILSWLLQRYTLLSTKLLSHGFSYRLFFPYVLRKKATPLLKSILSLVYRWRKLYWNVYFGSKLTISSLYYVHRFKWFSVAKNKYKMYIMHKMFYSNAARQFKYEGCIGILLTFVNHLHDVSYHLDGKFGPIKLV